MTQPSLYLEVLTPEKNLYSGSVGAVYLPGWDGQLGILPGHAPLVTKLGSGVIKCIEIQGGEKVFFCSGGFCEIMGGNVRILADISERREEIDEARADESRARAEKRIYSHTTDIDYERAVLSLQRAFERMQATGKKIR